MTELDQQEFDDALIRRALDLVSEHFDTVRIFVTRDSVNSIQETMAHSTGRGSFYAQYGHIKMWTLRQEELEKSQARKDSSDD